MKTNKNILQTIRDQEMDRRDFLKYSGIILISLIGLNSFMALLLKPEIPHITQTKESGRGFGGGKYGA
jgi:hypothetical protein